MDMNQLMQLAQNPQVQALIRSLLQQFTQGQGGGAGAQNLVSQLQQAGLGDQVESWLRQGANQPLTGQQLQQALGDGALTRVAEQAGLPPEQAGLPPERAADDLARIVPDVVDKASPNGQLDVNALQDILKQLTSTRSGG